MFQARWIALQLVVIFATLWPDIIHIGRLPSDVITGMNLTKYISVSRSTTLNQRAQQISYNINIFRNYNEMYRTTTRGDFCADGNRLKRSKVYTLSVLNPLYVITTSDLSAIKLTEPMPIQPKYISHTQ